MPCLGNTRRRHGCQTRHAVSAQVRPTSSLLQPQKRTAKITLGRKVPLVPAVQAGFALAPPHARRRMSDWSGVRGIETRRGLETCGWAKPHCGPTRTASARAPQEDSMRTYKVGYFVGSLSSTSINRVLSRALIRLAPQDLEFTELPIGNLPLYS